MNSGESTTSSMMRTTSREHLGLFRSQTSQGFTQSHKPTPSYKGSSKHPQAAMNSCKNDGRSRTP